VSLVVVAAFILLIVLVGLVSIVVLSSVKTVRQIERGVVFRWGKVQPQFRPPGLTMIFPVMDRMTKVNMQLIAMGVPAQEGITQDNVSVRVDAVVYFRVIDPVKATVNVQNYNWVISQVAQTSLRSVIGQADLQQLLSDRETINVELQQIMDAATEAPWGIKVQRVEIKDVSLAEGMKRSMARQAEAERERRARIITADGEFQASKRLAAAAEVMAQDPASLQLRLLQTVVEVAAEKNSTLVMPFPVEMLRFFDRAAGGDQTSREGNPRTNLAERLAKAEEELAKADEASSIASVDDVPPVQGLEPTKDKKGITPPAQDETAPKQDTGQWGGSSYGD
jgi:regulator of protease activity HflC (stomatin/prohibitin superfamily)